MADARRGEKVVRAIAVALIAVSVIKLGHHLFTSDLGMKTLGLGMRLAVTVFLVKKLIDGRRWTRWALVIKVTFGVIFAGMASIAAFDSSTASGIYSALLAAVLLAALMPLATSPNITAYCRERRSRPKS